ncbi:hypothetical protein [Sediminispirochaeta bajacaliforniensis]|uniref:hypothetical protein n=1 Tax=Sediminispirochaeta bajacaliforniensis TaxID=148 RepID=UPI0003767FEE|nr:hypothetical protein [Sediminispirochaeta bajacaliforniensis]
MHQRLYRILLSCIVLELSFFLLLPIAGADPIPDIVKTAYRFRAAIPEGTDPYKLGSKAEVIEQVVDKEHPDVQGLFTITDSQALFMLSARSIILCLLDHDGEASMYPRLVYSKDLTPERSFDKPHIQEVRTEFTFVGIGDSFSYRLERYPLFFPDGSFLITWRLKESLDGKMSQLYGSWYVKPLEPTSDGTPRTYIRNFVNTVFPDPIPGTTLAMKLFGTSDLRGFFKALESAAAKQ